SGHGAEEELKLMVSLVRPRDFVPIHGEYRQRSRHARIAQRMVRAGSRRSEVLVPDNGDLIRFDETGARIADKVPAGRVFIDGTRIGEVADEVLRDRRHLSEDGLIVAVMAINKQTGALESAPDIVPRGLAVDPNTDDLLRQAPGIVTDVIETASVEERTDHGLIKEKVRVELRRFFRKKSGRRPLVLPIVMEI
ncbi:MAG: ribonuclease J, partial [Acidobacteria bacterium]|nr:ribonuclease J [Acidobacteriota bacterium]